MRFHVIPTNINNNKYLDIIYYINEQESQPRYLVDGVSRLKTRNASDIFFAVFFFVRQIESSIVVTMDR